MYGHLVKATEVTAGLVEGNGSLLPDGWLIVTCGLTACTPGSAPGSTLGDEYGRSLPFFMLQNVLLFMTAGDDVGPGQFLLNGHEDVVSTLGPQFVQCFESFLHRVAQKCTPNLF